MTQLIVCFTILGDKNILSKIEIMDYMIQNYASKYLGLFVSFFLIRSMHTRKYINTKNKIIYSTPLVVHHIGYGINQNLI